MSEVKGTSHDNDVVFQTPADTSYSFRETDHCITSEQPWNGITVKSEEGKLTLTIKAGRSGSDEVAEYFKNATNSGFIVKTDSADSMPDKLNFAVKGVLINNNGKELGVVIAQGHNARGRNNWWVGLTEISAKGQSINVFDLEIKG